MEGEPVLLANLDGRYYAILDICSHQGVPLHDGFLEGNEIECALHGSSFDLRTGVVGLPPATEDLPTFKVQVEGKDILVGKG